MATDNLIKYSKALSYKLNDNAESGNSDGPKFTAQLRLDYINRAIGRFRRTLIAIDEDLANRVFKNLFKIYSNQTVTANKVALPTTEEITDIHSFYVQPTGDTNYYQCHRLTPQNYLEAKNGSLDDFYKPSTAGHKYFYSLVDREIVILSEEVSLGGKAEFIANASFNNFTYNGTSDLIIPNEYIDLFLSMASAEAMYDLGDTQSLNKATNYENYINAQLSIIMQKKQYQDIKGGVKE